MSAARLSALARGDLREITSFTKDRWGNKQAIKYALKLKSSLQRLAEYPSFGRPVRDRDPLRLRMEYGSHVIFYKKETNGIFILRILHKSMLPEQHNF